MLGIATGARLTAKTLDADLDDLKALEAHAIRWYPEWARVEPDEGSGNYDWSFPDRVVDGCTSRDLAICLGVQARLDGKALDASHLHPFGRYAGALATRYAGRGIIGWEGPNEIMVGRNKPHPKYDPNPTAVRYLPFQQAMHDAIKAADPTALVGTGSIIGEADWLTDLYAAGAAPYFDFIAYHPYTRPLSIQEAMHAGHGGWPAMLDARQVAVANGDAHKQFWITEDGWNTGGREPASEAEQAVYLADAFRRHARRAFFGPMFVFCGWDADDPTSTDPGDHMGLLRADRTEKPAAVAFRAAAA